MLTKKYIIKSISSILKDAKFWVLQYFGKPNTLSIPLYERPTAHWEWTDGESNVYTPSGIHQEWHLGMGYYTLG
jgi:hypothetical protein